MKIRKPTTVIALSLGIVLASGGGAYAYWTVSGSGTGTATVATIKPLEITQVAITGLVLDHAVNLSGKIKNPNSFEVSLKGTHLTASGSIDLAHAACNFDQNFTVKTPTVTADKIPANGEVSFASGTITLNNCDNRNQLVCQGATVTLAYVLK